MNSFKLGAMLACLENGVDPNHLPHLEGIAKTAATQPGPLGRLLAGAAFDVMATCGRAHTAPAQHLLLVSKQASWSPQCQDVIEILEHTLLTLTPLEKKAFQISGGDVMGGLGSAAKGVGYGSMIAGGGLGALYWLLSRHATQDDSDVEAMQQQADYYRNLTKELEHNLRRKYNYPSNRANHANHANEAAQEQQSEPQALPQA